jgi:hypothetical protein
MDTTLRPMSTSQVLDRTFQLFKSHFALLAGIGLLLPALLMFLQLSFIPLGFPPRANLGTSPQSLVVLLLGFFACYAVVYIVGHALAAGATVYSVAKLHLGEKVTIGQAYKQVFSRFWRVLGIVILVFLMAFGVVFVGELIAIIIAAVLVGSMRTVAASAAPFVTVIAVIFAIAVFLAGVFGGFYFYCKFSLAVPACVLEQLPIGAAISRSWSLTKSAVWRLMLVFLLTWVLALVLGIAFTLPGQLYSLATHGKSFLLGVILQQIGGFVAGVLANPIATIAISLIYYDQRVRKEAFDLQLMMEAMGQLASPQAAGAAPGIG